MGILYYAKHFMNHGSTLFLRFVIYLMGVVALAICIIAVGNAFFNEEVGSYLPVLFLPPITAIPFFFALYQGLLLLRYIDKNTAFSGASVKAITTIKYCAFAVSAIYALGMPYIIYAADKDDAPGVVLIGLVLIFAPLVVGVFAAVLEMLLKNAIEIKSENELTV